VGQWSVWWNLSDHRSSAFSKPPFNRYCCIIAGIPFWITQPQSVIVFWVRDQKAGATDTSVVIFFSSQGNVVWTIGFSASVVPNAKYSQSGIVLFWPLVIARTVCFIAALGCFLWIGCKLAGISSPYFSLKACSVFASTISSFSGKMNGNIGLAVGKQFLHRVPNLFASQVPFFG